MLLVAVSIVRLIVPFFIFSHALITITISLLFDNMDGYVSYRAGLNWKKYNTLDKLLDYWWYIFILIYSIPLNIFPIILILFLVRSIGQFMAIKTQNTRCLLYYPNALEFFFIFYVVHKTIFPSGILFEGINIVIPFITSIILAATQEYRIHIKKQYFANFFWKLDLDWKRNK